MRSPLLVVPLAAGLLACSGLLGPSFEARDGKLEGGLFSAKGVCTVKNLGNEPAPATVSYTLTLADGTVVKADEYAMLNPKEEKEVEHVFDGVRVKDREGAAVECEARAAR